jgi:pectate lyase
MRSCFIIALALILSFNMQAQDDCQSIGWANYNGQTYVGPPTGGGSAAVTQVTTFAQLKAAAEATGPRVIHVMNDMGNGYKGQTGDVINVKANKTIIGVKPNITVKCSWQIREQNIIIKNLVLRGPGNSNSQQNWDVVNISGSNAKRIWFDHCTIMEGEDGNFDVVKGADNVSVTWCKFTYVTAGGHNFSNLIGSSDNESISHGKLNVTFAYCWWDNVSSRTPRSRYGKIHVFNSYYTKSGGPRAGFMANQRIEACHFDGSKGIGTITTGGKVVTAAIGCLGQADRTISEGGYTIFTPPYPYKLYAASEVKALVTSPTCGAGPTMTSPTQCGCGTPTTPSLQLVSANSPQVVASGKAIANIVYNWGGTATDVTVTGLPAGLIATKNASAKTVTISGTPTASGTFTVTTVQPSGSAKSLTGTVTIAANVAPTVSITSPANNASFTAPASFTITANADSDGTVNNAGEDNGSNVAAGTYRLTARAVAITTRP